MRFLNKRNLTRTNKRYDQTPVRVDHSFVSSIVNELGANLNPKEQKALEDHSDLAELRVLWYEISGSVLAAHTVPLHLFNGTLVVACDHSIFANQVSMMQPVLTQKIQEKYGWRIKKIRTKIESNIWKHLKVTPTSNEKTGDIMSHHPKMAVPLQGEELEKAKILDALEIDMKKIAQGPPDGKRTKSN